MIRLYPMRYCTPRGVRGSTLSVFVGVGEQRVSSKSFCYDGAKEAVLVPPNLISTILLDKIEEACWMMLQLTLQWMAV